MDLLSDVFSALRTQGQIWGRITLEGSYALCFPRLHGVFLAVMAGQCWLNREAEPLLLLREGDFVFLPLPSAFYLRSDPHLVTAEPLGEARLTRWLDARIVEKIDGSGARCALVAGCFTFTSHEAPLFIRELPSLLHVTKETAEPSTRHIMTLMQQEVAGGAPGATAIVDRLAEILLMHAIRHAITGEAQSHEPNHKQSHTRNAAQRRATGWLRAMQDPRIHAAMRLMHEAPGQSWTVARLAQSVGMSRSAFAEHFRTHVGKTPLEHLTAWRMARAANLLRDRPDLKIEAIACQFGYASERAFRTAFSKTMGAPPGAFRQNDRADVEFFPPAGPIEGDQVDKGFS